PPRQPGRKRPRRPAIALPRGRDAGQRGADRRERPGVRLAHQRRAAHQHDRPALERAAHRRGAVPGSAVGPDRVVRVEAGATRKVAQEPARARYNPGVTEPTSIRAEYEKHGAAEFYARSGRNYRNPHEPQVRRSIELAVRTWRPDLSRVLDLAAGSGEVTLALRDRGA